MNLIGVGLIVVFSIYALSRIWAARNIEDKRVRVKAIVFYLFLVGMAILFYVISAVGGETLEFTE